MRAEDLFALADIHGIDLQYAIRLHERQRKSESRLVRNSQGGYSVIMVPSDEAVLTKARGKGTRTSRRPSNTHAELAQALHGVGPDETKASLYHHCHAHQYHDELRRSLVREAGPLAARDEWPQSIKDDRGIEVAYIQHLADAILIEDAHPAAFAASPLVSHRSLHAIVMHVTDKVWERDLTGPYAQLQFVWLTWLGTAQAEVQKKLREEA